MTTTPDVGTRVPFPGPLEKATTFPAWMYDDEALLEVEYERIFERTWQWFCRADQVATPGDYVTGRVGREPVVVVRDRDGTLRALSNVCRHRAGPVCLGNGNAKALRCQYHGWTYGLAGDLRHTPDFADVEDFDRADFGLPPFAVDLWRGHVFVHVGDEPGRLLDALGPLPRYAERYDLESLTYSHRDTYRLDCNWKAFLDNTLEGYHVPLVHPELRDPGSKYGYEVLGPVARQVAWDPAVAGDDLPGPGATTNGEFLNVFPNWIINLFMQGAFTVLIDPVDVGHTDMHVDYWFPPDEPGVGGTVGRIAGRAIAYVVREHATSLPGRKVVKREPSGAERWVEEKVTRMLTEPSPTLERYVMPELSRRLLHFYTDVTQRQDVAISVHVQRGLESPTYDTGRFSVSQEVLVHHFQGLLSQMLHRR